MLQSALRVRQLRRQIGVLFLQPLSSIFSPDGALMPEEQIAQTDIANRVEQTLPSAQREQSHAGLEDQDESTLRKQKLLLEIGALRQSNKLNLEVIKVLATPIALGGIFVTLVLGILQSRQSARSQDDARFYQSITRLSAANDAERISGVVGMELFLEPNQKTRHQATLRYFASALTMETNETVRAALLDVIGNLRVETVGQSNLNDLLEKLRDRNRKLYQHLLLLAASKTPEGQSTDAFLTEHNDETGVSSFNDEERGPLEASASAIAALIRNGAKTKDLTGIYCKGCDFSGKPREARVTGDFAALSASTSIDLSGTRFDSAILPWSNFIGTTLKDTSFDGADLVNANFSGADLSRARLTDFRGGRYFFKAEQNPRAGLGGVMPDFSCANLSDADFTRSDFFEIFSLFQSVLLGGTPTLEGTNLAGARLQEVGVIDAAKTPEDTSHVIEERIYEGSLTERL